MLKTVHSLPKADGQAVVKMVQVIAPTDAYGWDSATQRSSWLANSTGNGSWTMRTTAPSTRVTWTNGGPLRHGMAY